jgi:hypothetical protein
MAWDVDTVVLTDVTPVVLVTIVWIVLVVLLVTVVDASTRSEVVVVDIVDVAVNKLVCATAVIVEVVFAIKVMVVIGIATNNSPQLTLVG